MLAAFESSSDNFRFCACWLVTVSIANTVSSSTFLLCNIFLEIQIFHLLRKNITFSTLLKIKHVRNKFIICKASLPINAGQIHTNDFDAYTFQEFNKCLCLHNWNPALNSIKLQHCHHIFIFTHDIFPYLYLSVYISFTIESTTTTCLQDPLQINFLNIQQFLENISETRPQIYHSLQQNMQNKKNREEKLKLCSHLSQLQNLPRPI